VRPHSKLTETPGVEFKIERFPLRVTLFAVKTPAFIVVAEANSKLAWVSLVEVVITAAAVLCVSRDVVVVGEAWHPTANNIIMSRATIIMPINLNFKRTISNILADYEAKTRICYILYGTTSILYYERSPRWFFMVRYISTYPGFSNIKVNISGKQLDLNFISSGTIKLIDKI
jgi:hypothetical protein